MHLVGRDRTHLGIREVRDEFVQRLGRQQRVGVAEDEDLARSPVHRFVQRLQLADAWQIDHEVRARVACPFDRAIIRPVGGDDDLQQRRGIRGAEEIRRPCSR